MVDWRKYISINPEIRFGKPCLSGTRISVGDVLSWLASGLTHAEIMEDFPQLSTEQILAVLAYSAERESITKIVAA
jgi:uncharacterized protein (DUF433 family)